jgi:acetyl esterase/lipase
MGSRTAFDGECQYLASQGYVAATVDYRLADAACTGGGCNQNFFPAQAQDVRCAVRWFKSVANSYGGDPSRIAVIGTSAGGHLAALLGTETAVPGLDGLCPVSAPSPDVSAVVGFYGPYDLTAAASAGYNSDIYNLFGVWPPSPAQLLLASPEQHVASGAPPFLLLHGTADQTVPYSMSVEMLTACHGAGVDATLVTVANAGHGFPVFSPLPEYEESSCTTLAFLAKYLHP